MATIKVVFRCSSRSANEGSLFYRVIHRRKIRQVHTGYRIMPDEWNDTTGEIDIAGAPDSRREYLREVQRSMDEGLDRLSGIVSELEESDGEYTVEDIVARYKRPKCAGGFMSFARANVEGLEQIGRKRSAQHFATTLNSLARFVGDREIPFEEFTGKLMLRYEQHLGEQGLCPNSISYYMRKLRSLYNKAVEQGLTEQKYPFRHVYTGIAKTVKRAVTLGTIKRMRNLDLSHDRLAELARDLFLFSFCTRGMAIIDIAYLRKSNLKKGVLSYRRQKTGKLLSIRWEAQMQEIVARHSCSCSDFIFPLIDSEKPDYRKQYLNIYSRLIRRLKKIGEHLGLSEPLTFHRSRHAWASIARDNNIPLSVISEGMGHDSEKTTRIYLASLDASVVDKANRHIMGLVYK